MSDTPTATDLRKGDMQDSNLSSPADVSAASVEDDAKI